MRGYGLFGKEGSLQQEGSDVLCSTIQLRQVAIRFGGLDGKTWWTRPTQVPMTLAWNCLDQTVPALSTILLVLRGVFELTIQYINDYMVHD